MGLNAVAAHLLTDAEVYLNDIDPDIYSMPLDLLFGATLGQHTRHFLEFYQCLVQQVSSGDGVIDYAKRVRDLRLESEPQFALSAIRELQGSLEGLDTNSTCQLACSEHFEGSTSRTVETNLERELLYNIEHTIHHLAIIKIGLAAVAPQIDLPEHFGVAPSTIQHRSGACAQ